MTFIVETGFKPVSTLQGKLLSFQVFFKKLNCYEKYLINLLILKVISYTFNINFLVKSFMNVVMKKIFLAWLFVLSDYLR